MKKYFKLLLIILFLSSCAKNKPDATDPTDSTIPPEKPTCCNSELVVSVAGKRWKWKSAFISKSAFNSNNLRVNIYPTTVSSDKGCNNFETNSTYFISWEMPNSSPSITFTSYNPAVFYYQNAGKSAQLKITHGQAQVGSNVNGSAPIQIDIQENLESWASGSLKAELCEGL